MWGYMDYLKPSNAYNYIADSALELANTSYKNVSYYVYDATWSEWLSLSLRLADTFFQSTVECMEAEGTMKEWYC